MAAGPVSRLGSFEPGDKSGLRLSPHLAPDPISKLEEQSWSSSSLVRQGGVPEVRQGGVRRCAKEA